MESVVASSSRHGVELWLGYLGRKCVSIADRCSQALSVEDLPVVEIVDSDSVELDDGDEVEGICECCVREDYFRNRVRKLVLYVMLLEGSQVGDDAWRL